MRSTLPSLNHQTFENKEIMQLAIKIFPEKEARGKMTMADLMSASKCAIVSSAIAFDMLQHCFICFTHN